MPLDGSEDLSCQALTELDRSDPGEDALVSDQHLLNGLAENCRLQIFSGLFYFGKFGHGLWPPFLIASLSCFAQRSILGETA
jgi:hypothetical protein